ncbi:hypothetical protein [Butyricimonas muris]|uniref:hypothetical protein n=1 Tax=Butyricimonas muris TaxID=3378067 RepID=UPI003967C13B
MGIIDKKSAMQLALGTDGGATTKVLQGEGITKGLGNAFTWLKALGLLREGYLELRELLDLNDKDLIRYNELSKRAFDSTVESLNKEEEALKLMLKRYQELVAIENQSIDQKMEMHKLVYSLSKFAPKAVDGNFGIDAIPNVNVDEVMAEVTEQKKLIDSFKDMKITDLVSEFHRETKEINILQQELEANAKWSSFDFTSFTEELSEAERVAAEQTLKDLENKRSLIVKMFVQAGIGRGDIIQELPKLFRESLFSWETMDFKDMETEDRREASDFLRTEVDRQKYVVGYVAKIMQEEEIQRKGLKEKIDIRKKELQGMLQPNSSASPNEIAEKEADIAKLEDELGGKKVETSQKQEKVPAKNKRVQDQEAISALLLNNLITLEESRLSLMEDGKNKRLALSALEHKMTEKEIKEQLAAQQTLFEQAGQEMPEEVRGSFTRRLEQNDNNKFDRDRTIEKQYEEELRQRTEGLTQFFLTEEQRKRDAVKARYDEQRTWAEKQKKTGSLPEGEYNTFVQKVNEAEQKEQYARLLDELNDFESRKAQITREWDDKIVTAQGNDKLVVQLKEQKQKALSSLGAEEIMASDDWENLFTNMDDLTVKQIDQLMENIQAKIDSNEPTLKSVDMKALAGKLEEARQKVATLNPFRAMADSMKDMFSKGSNEAGESSDEIGNKWKNLGASTKGCFDFINDAVGSCSVLSDVLGESGQQTMGMIQGVATAGITMATAIDSVEKGSVVLAVIGAALTAVTAIMSMFNKDKKQEKKIKGLQREIDNLERAYDRLGATIDNTYTEDVYRMMDEQNEKLQEQQVLIQQQIEAEGKKKKKDKDKINSWKNEIEDINQKIEENKRKQIEMLAGTDVQSAINDFADALTEAYAKGEDGVKALGDTTKKVMANAVKEALKKKFLGESIESAVNYLGEHMKDGVLSESEQAEFTRMVEEGGKSYTKAMEAYSGLFKDAYNDAPEGVSGQLQAAMTEGTASELVGLWNSTAMDVRVIRDWLLTGTDVSVPRPGFDLGELLEQQYRIEQNTRMTVYQLQDGFGRMGQQLDAIERNTRGYYGRGR